MPTAPLWTPSPRQIATSRLAAFIAQVNREHDLGIETYEELHRWSINAPDDFWATTWSFCDVRASTPWGQVLEDRDHFPGARWFTGSRLNFAENLLRFSDDRMALVSFLENGERRSLTFSELEDAVARLSHAMRRHGIRSGDRVAGFLPNIIEAVVAMLATTSIGAVWSSCSPDFGQNGVRDRFGQIAPRLLFTSDGYHYNGKVIDCLDRVRSIRAEIGSIERVIIVPLVSETPDLGPIEGAILFDDFTAAGPAPLEFEQLPFDHPLYIMYSSGTTGMPKCIVHGSGGTLLQHLKEHQLHADLTRDDVLFYFTTCGWMMWNWLVSGLATGATVVLYDGSPFAREGRLLLDMIDDEGITVFGTSAKFIAALEKAGVEPKTTHTLATLRTILSTGSPLSQEGFDYIYRSFKQDLCLSSISGGTDIISCFVLGNPTGPVHRGEIQCLGLGMDVDFWDDQGASLPVGEKGELVCKQPFPSAPIGFWNDPDGKKYRGAYFARFPGVWAHGDYGEVTPNGGVIIHGRSDAVLNPGGVRIGTAEIYRQVEKVPAVVDSIVVGQDWDDDTRVILFVVLRDGLQLDDNIRNEIRRMVRNNATPRHVPGKILQVPDIPRTISGKIVELAVRNVIHGEPVRNTDALANPEALAHFRDLAELEAD